MKQINSVAIIGAGALGLMFMDSMIKNEDKDIFFISDSNRYKQLKNKTFNINNIPKEFPVKTVSKISKKVDLILVCVKNYHLDSITPLLQEIADADTIVISVLNGITSESFLELIVPKSTVLYCAVLGMDAVKEGDVLNFTNKGKFLIGTKDNKPNIELKKFVELLKISNLDYLIPKDIHREIWYKWMINIGINQVSAVTGAVYGLFQSDKILQELMENAMKETIEIAQKENISLCKEDISKWYKILFTLGANGKTSMLQDIEASRKTEIESFAGDIIKLASKHSINVPVNDTLYRIIKTKERMF